MSEQVGSNDLAPPVSLEAARRIVSNVLVGGAMQSARVDFAVGQFFNAPSHPVWLVYPHEDRGRMGSSALVAICPQTGRVLFHGRVGE